MDARVEASHSCTTTPVLLAVKDCKAVTYSGWILLWHAIRPDAHDLRSQLLLDVRVQGKKTEGEGKRVCTRL